MFNPKTERIKKLAELFPVRITELEEIFGSSANIYIDYANVRPWANKLGWHVDLKWLKQFLDSFDVIKSIKFYSGKLKGDADSESLQKEIEGLGYNLKTKQVKIMKLSIDVSSISRTYAFAPKLSFWGRSPKNLKRKISLRGERFFAFGSE